MLGGKDDKGKDNKGKGCALGPIILSSDEDKDDEGEEKNQAPNRVPEGMRKNHKAEKQHVFNSGSKGHWLGGKQNKRVAQVADLDTAGNPGATRSGGSSLATTRDKFVKLEGVRKEGSILSLSA